jgi:hypothetical protein
VTGGRCPATFWLTRHDVIMRQKFAEDGRIAQPHVLLWECQRCGRIVGETTTWPPRQSRRRKEPHDSAA